MGRSAALLAVLLALPGAGCGGAAPAEAGGIPRRIVCLVPSATETLFALGAGERVVGVDDWSDHPEAVRALPRMGGKGSFSAERILEARPDLVIVFRTETRLAETLRGLGLRVLAPATEGLDALGEGILDVARAAGLRERGEALVEEIRRGLEEVRESAAAKPRRRVLVVLDREPLYVPSPESFLGRLLDLVRAECPRPREALGTAWPTVSLEEVIDFRPDVIVDLATGPDRDAAAAEARRFWARHGNIPAVAAGRVHVLPDPLLARPGPRAVEIAARLLRTIHGE